jgi:hypothetical protein
MARTVADADLMLDSLSQYLAIDPLSCPGITDMHRHSADLSALRVGFTADLGFSPIDAGRRIPLISIMPDSFGQSRPNSVLTVGPGARVLHTPHHMRSEAGGAQMLTPVRELLDGVNVIEVLPPTPVRLFHICLERHAAVQAGGIEMETFHPGANAMRTVSHSLQGRFLSMFPRIGHVSDFGPLAHPRAPAPQDDTLTA